MQYQYHPLLFNPVYWHIKDAFNDPNIRHIYLMGGSSAAKTYEAVQAICTQCAEEDSSAVVFRKEQASMPDTIQGDFEEVNERLQLDMHQTAFRFKLSNRSMIRLRGLDKAGKVKGLKGYRRIIADELDQFDIDDFKEMRRRLRGKAGQQLLYTWNPVDEDHWIKKQVLDNIEWIPAPLTISPRPKGARTRLHRTSGKWYSADGTSVLIKTTYRDNHYIVGNPIDPAYGFVDHHTIAEFDFLKRFDENDYQVYAMGNWGAVRTGFEYYHKYDVAKHMHSHGKPIPNLPLHITFDFNGLPYMTASVWQIITSGDKVEFRCLQEYSMKPPANTIEDTCARILDDWEWFIRQTGCFVYGDSTGKNNMPLKRLKHLYQAIIESMGGYVSRDQIRLLKSNPLHKLRRRELNRVLFEEHGFAIRVHDSCTDLHKDLKRCQQDANGAKAKPKKTVNGVSYEELGHHSDAMDYFICWILEKVYDVVIFNSRKAA